MPVLPPIIGGYTQEDFDAVSRFCRTYSSGACLRVPPLEGECAKLMTNAARYVPFALSNEFALVSALCNVNINRIMEAANTDYPCRLDWLEAMGARRTKPAFAGQLDGQEEHTFGVPIAARR